MVVKVTHEQRLSDALGTIKRQLNRTLLNDRNTHALALPEGSTHFVSVGPGEKGNDEIRAFLTELRELLGEEGKRTIDSVLRRGVEIHKDVRKHIADTALLETFRVDDASDAMPFEGGDRYFNTLYETICRHNHYDAESTKFKLFKLTDTDSERLTVPNFWEKAKFKLSEFKKPALPLDRPTVIILPGLTTSDPAIIGSTDPEMLDESTPLASVITRHISISGASIGNAKNQEHNCNVLFMTHGDDFAKLQAWHDITRHNEDIKSGKPADEIFVTPRTTSFVEQYLRPTYFKDGKKQDEEAVKQALSKILFAGYSAGTSASSMIALAVHRDMRKMGFTPDQADEMVPHLHVLNIAAVSNPIAHSGGPTTLTIQNDTDRYAKLSTFKDAFPKEQQKCDIRKVFVDKHQLLLQPKDPGDSYPSYVISRDGESRSPRYREDLEKHNAPSLLSRSMMQNSNGDGIEVRPPVENPGSMMTHYFIADWHDRAIDPKSVRIPPEESLEGVYKRAEEFQYSWLDKIRPNGLPGTEESSRGANL